MARPTPALRAKKKLRIPIGIEKLLCRAAADEAFRTLLLNERAVALDGLGDGLDDEERVMLGAIPASTLAVMIERIDLKRHSRKRFMKGVMAAAFVAASSLLTVECDEDVSKGIAPDDVVWRSDVQAAIQADIVEDVYRPQDAAGVGPDVADELAADVIEQEEMMAVTGIMPDAQ